MFDFKKLSARLFDARLSLKSFAAALLFLSAFALLPIAASAQKEKIVTKPVAFTKGKSSATVKGTAQAYTTYAYTLRTKANQNMNIRLTSANKNVFFTVFAPGGLGALTGEDEVTDFDEILDKTGVYKIMVFSKSDAGASSYTLKITVTNGEKY